MKNIILFICVFIFCLINRVSAYQVIKSDYDQHNSANKSMSYNDMPDILPGTKHLTWNVHLSDTMMSGAHELIQEKINESKSGRLKLWDRNFNSHEEYELSVEPNRKQLMKFIGIKDEELSNGNFNIGLENKPPSVLMQRFSNNNDSVIIASTSKYRVIQVRWPVLDGVYGEGLLLQPKKSIKANVIAIPDADQTPEQLVGLSSGIPDKSQFARRLAENGFQVLVPVLISRKKIELDNGSQQTYREWIYRQAFHMGKHIIGYEVEKIIAAIDWFKKEYGNSSKVGVAGYCEGGLIAFYSAAIDKRIDAAFVSGYFESRQEVWNEPIYRNVWGLLTEFGDAEIASLIAPDALIIEHSFISDSLEKITAKPHPFEESSYTGYKGRLRTPSFKDVQAEFNRINDLSKIGSESRYLFAAKENNPVNFGSKKAIEKFTQVLDNDSSLSISNEMPVDNRSSFSIEERQKRQVKEIEDHVQGLLHESEYKRNDFFLYQVMPEFKEKKWSTKRYKQYYKPDRFIKKVKEYREYFWEEILGKFDKEMLAPNARTRKVYDKKRWTGYEVVLDVYSNFITPGILLIPKDIEPGEQRPVVVAQHGRNGVPKDLIEGSTSYYNMAAKLADHGFVVYAPNGLFRGEDQYRWLDRKANAVKKTLFSFIISQHKQTLQWLGTLPFVDSDRIGFYGKSYGGETAMRVPAVLEDYSLSICSADFGDWTRKVVGTHYQNSFMNTIEWEMPYFNMGSTFSYAEMAYLIFPRPFMVERGRHDTVQPDEWVAYEYEKVRHLYVQFNHRNKTEIEYFNGGHASRNEGTFEFLHKHLNWP